MNKQEFLTLLRKGLKGLPQEDIEERVIFYSEMIDDRIEEGLTEDEAVSEIGPVGAVVSQILSDTPITRLVKEKVKPNRTLSPLEIVLLVLGSPIWISLLMAVIAVIFAVYIVLWAVVISLWAVSVAVAVSSIGIIAASVVMLVFYGNKLAALALLGVGIFCAGISIFMFITSGAVSKGILLLTKRIALGIKSWFVGKETA